MDVKTIHQNFDGSYRNEKAFLVQLLWLDCFPEERAHYIDLIRETISHGVNFHYLHQMGCAMPLIHYHFNPTPHRPHPEDVGIPEFILQRGTERFNEFGSENRQRLEAIPALFRALRLNCPDFGPDKAPLLILKGVSELLGFYQDAYPAVYGKYDFPLMDYRPMGDTDCICRPQDLDRFDKIFQQAGNVYDTYGFGYLNLEQERLNRKIVSTVSHLMYNFYEIGHLELHPFITRGKNLKSYPSDLTPFLWETARPIQYQGETAWIPGIEASAIYHVCHATAIKEIYSIVFHFKYEPERLLWEGFYADMEDCYLNRLEILFIFHLYKWYFFLRQYHWELDYRFVEKFLLKVPQYESIDLFLQFVQQVGPLKGDYLQPHLRNTPLSPEERLAQKLRVMEYCRKDNIFEEKLPEETF